MEKLYIGTVFVLAAPIKDSVGDISEYVVRGADNVTYCVPSEIFERTYREVNGSEINLISFAAKKEKEA
jgi:hypothetical protein